jgi:translocating chain-associated membrane protein 1
MHKFIPTNIYSFTILSQCRFLVWNVLFVIVRLLTITLAALTFWFGLSKSSRPAISISEGNFNTYMIRVNCLAAICLLQAWMMWNFITFHLRRRRERQGAQPSSAPKRTFSEKKAAKKPKNSPGGRLSFCLPYLIS